jgi:serine/threonine protein kinase
METASACPGVEILELYAVGRVSDAEARRLEEHLKGCLPCIARLPTLGEGDPLVQALRAPKNQSPSEIAVVNRLQEQLRGLRPPIATARLVATNALDGNATPSSGESVEAEEDVRALLAPAQDADEIGRLGPYRVLDVVGLGGMGVVFAAEDPQLKRPIALKAIRPALATNSGARQRFRQEAQRMAALTHDHILAIHHIGEDRGVLFLAMPLLQGESLEDRLRRQSPLPLAEVLRIGRETALGLAAAHERGVIHRDVKPANLWLEAPTRRVKILDFGLARLVEDDTGLTSSGAIVGTPSYMAPEQVEGQVDSRADLFSLGCVLYRMVTGRLAFPGRTRAEILQAIATQNPDPPRQINPATPDWLDRLIERLLSKNRAARPDSAATVVQALEEIERDAVISQPAGTGATPEERFTNADEAVLAPLTGVPSLPDVSPMPMSPAATNESKPPTPRWFWLAAAAGLTLAVIVLLRTLGRHPPERPTSPSQTAVHAPDLTDIMTLDVMLTRNVNDRGLPAGLIGKQVFDPRLGDTVAVQVQLTRPAYAFLIAFRPDGHADVCFPEREDELPPLTDNPGYPSTAASAGKEYGLSDGEGLQVFAVVVSSQRLPVFQEWWSQCKECPWKKTDAPPGVVYRGNGQDRVEAWNAEGAARGKGVEVQGKTPVAELAAWLRKMPRIETVQVLGFAVAAKVKR